MEGGSGEVGCELEHCWEELGWEEGWGRLSGMTPLERRCDVLDCVCVLRGCAGLLIGSRSSCVGVQVDSQDVSVWGH